MHVRVLTEWRGSGPCGAVMELPDGLAHAQIAAGNAERVAAPPSVEAAMVDLASLETAVSPAARVPRPRRRP